MGSIFFKRKLIFLSILFLLHVRRMGSKYCCFLSGCYIFEAPSAKNSGILVIITLLHCLSLELIIFEKEHKNVPRWKNPYGVEILDFIILYIL